MKLLAVVTGLVVVCTLGLVGYIHSRKKEEIQLTKTCYFENIKHRVTSDVMKEYQSNVAEANSRLDQTNNQVEKLKSAVNEALEAADAKRAELNTCSGDLTRIKDEAAAVDVERNKSDSEFQQTKTSLKEQINNLKKEVEQRSKVCNYIDMSSTEGMKLCGIEPPKAA